MTSAEPLPQPSSPERDPLDAAAREDLRDLFSVESLHRRGAGGDSILYMARDLEYEQLVAVKVMGRSLGDEDSAAAEEAFHKAAAAAAALDHPHIVQLYSAGATDRLFWWSMRYVEGRSLAEKLRSSGPMDWSVCLRVIDEVAAALESAHRLGVVHGGLTPTNVLIDAAGHAQVTDFWVPWVVRHWQTSARTRPGPETDQAGLAALVEVCLGKAGAELPAHIARAVARATSPSPADRFPSVLGFRGALDRSSPRPPGAKPVPLQLLGYEAPTHGSHWRWIPVALVTLLALGAVAAPWVMSSGSSGGPAERPAARPPLATPRAESLPALPAPELPPEAARDSLAALPRATPSAPAPAPVIPARPRVTTPVHRSAAPRAPRAVEPGRLFINATPWGQVYLDDQLLGNTPQVGVSVPPGAHRLRVVRDGFTPYEAEINLAPGQQLRITDIVLHEMKP